MIREILICFMGVNFVLSMSTTKAPNLSTATHQTREPAEHETFLFKYEPHFHNMIVVTFIDSVRTCYIFDLSDDERAAIHTDAGIRAVEEDLYDTPCIMSGASTHLSNQPHIIPSFLRAKNKTQMLMGN